MSVKINEEILISYLNGSLDKKDNEKVEQWYSGSEENRKLLEQLYYTMFVSETSARLKSINVDKKLSELKAIINKKEEPAKKKKHSMLFYISRVGVAAAFIGILLFGGLTFYKISVSNTNSFYVVTGLGERAQVTLPDGTKVWVGACSKIEYRSPIFADERVVDMEGEVYFEVAPDKKKPFIINSDRQIAKVLGTKFNIRANKDERYIITTLLEGSIAVSSFASEEKSVIMKPSEQLVFDTSTGHQDLQVCEVAEEYISWVKGVLHFDNSTLTQIATELERYYNVKITIEDDKLKEERFTANFDTKENIYQILSILKMTNKFDYKTNSRNIEIYSR